MVPWLDEWCIRRPLLGRQHKWRWTDIFFRSFTPSQIPDHFNIVPLPSKISSWLILLLERLPVKEQLLEIHTQIKLRRGQYGKTTAYQLEFSRMISSTTLPEVNESEPWEPLPWISVKGYFQDHLTEPWLKEQSELPFHMSHRPSRKMSGQIQQKMKTTNLEDFYWGSTEPKKTASQIKKNKSPSPSALLLKSTEIGGFFYACRSCEYLMVPQVKKKRTNILRLRCLRFLKYGRELQHSDPYLECTDCVSINFEWQKRYKRNDTVTQLASEHTIIFPVQQWNALVKRIRKYPGSTGDTPVPAVWKNHKIDHVVWSHDHRIPIEWFPIGKFSINGNHLSIRQYSSISRYCEDRSIGQYSSIEKYSSIGRYWENHLSIWQQSPIRRYCKNR